MTIPFRSSEEDQQGKRMTEFNREQAIAVFRCSSEDQQGKMMIAFEREQAVAALREPLPCDAGSQPSLYMSKAARQILDLLRRQGPKTRVEIAESLMLTKNCVQNNIFHLTKHLKIAATSRPAPERPSYYEVIDEAE